MVKHPSIRAWLAAAVLGAAGCATPGPLEQTPLSQDELDSFLASGRDARTYGITTYQDAAGARFEFANRVHMDRTVLLAFVSPKSGPRPVIPAETALSGVFPPLLDSSARQSWAAMSSIKGLEYRLFAPPSGEYADHVVSDIPGYAGVGNKLILEDLHIESPIFYLAPARGGLGPLARVGENPDATPQSTKAADKTARKMPAVAGAALMRTFAFLRFDFPGRSVLFSTHGTYKPMAAAAVYAALPLRDWKGRPAVQATLGGEPITLVIDTAGDFDLSLPGGVAAAGPLVLGDLQIDDFQPSVHADHGLPEAFPARLGLGVLSRFAVTLDFKQQRVWFEGKPLPEAEESATSGEDEPPAPLQYRGVRP